MFGAWRPEGGMRERWRTITCVKLNGADPSDQNESHVGKLHFRENSKM